VRNFATPIQKKNPILSEAVSVAFDDVSSIIFIVKRCCFASYRFKASLFYATVCIYVIFVLFYQSQF